MKDLQITIVQTALLWQNVSGNLEALEEKILGITEETNVIFLPEMFTTGFSMEPEKCAEQMNGPTMQWMARLAEAKKAVITGSIIIEENNKYYNRLIWMYPGGMYQIYDKRHLFGMANEDQYYEAGDEKVIINYKGWRICPMICYDLRFPVWARNEDEFDILFYVANWPNKRSYDWKSLLAARAIENQCYVIGVNRVGTDENGHEYSGNSMVVDPGWNKVLFEKSEEEIVFTTSLSAHHLKEVRSKLPFLQDRDAFTLL